MRPRGAVVVGAARDCARHLPRVLENLERLAGLYGEAHFIFAVSDSTDGTAGLLEAWLATGRAGRVLDLGALEDEVPIRAERIARARNACLDALRGGPLAAFDHLIVADLDDVMTGELALDAFAAAGNWLEARPERAGVFANATPRYYDIWALRHDRWCPGDCWHPIWGRPRHEAFEAAKIREVFSRQIEIPADLPPIAVRSAFGGLGLYKMRYALGASYSGRDAAGRPVSEHVAFNRAIGDAGGRLHIFPALTVQAPQEHLYRAGEFGWRWRLAMGCRRLADRRHPPWRTLALDRGDTDRD